MLDDIAVEKFVCLIIASWILHPLQRDPEIGGGDRKIATAGALAAGAAGRMGPRKWTRPRRQQQLLPLPPWISGDPPL
jgi:hypothetical protein